jgi:hypothetical protein
MKVFYSEGAKRLQNASQEEIRIPDTQPPSGASVTKK